MQSGELKSVEGTWYNDPQSELAYQSNGEVAFCGHAKCVASFPPGDNLPQLPTLLLSLARHGVDGAAVSTINGSLEL